MQLLISTLNSESGTLIKNNVRLLAIGDIKSLPARVADQLQETINITAPNKGLSLVLALSYSGRWEITNAVRQIAELAKNNKIHLDDINDSFFASKLQCSFVPDPELLIRTSGEYRISNFLLWQIAYTELYFTEALWPDFRKEDFYKAIIDYQRRERRFGKTSEQI
jgi:undecaprenyl diphosphate synthase